MNNALAVEPPAPPSGETSIEILNGKALQLGGEVAVGPADEGVEELPGVGGFAGGGDLGGDDLAAGALEGDPALVAEVVPSGAVLLFSAEAAKGAPAASRQARDFGLHGVEEVKTADGNDADETFRGTSSGRGTRVNWTPDNSIAGRKEQGKDEGNCGDGGAEDGGPECIYGTPGAGYNA